VSFLRRKNRARSRHAAAKRRASSSVMGVGQERQRPRVAGVVGWLWLCRNVMGFSAHCKRFDISVRLSEVLGVTSGFHGERQMQPAGDVVFREF
jgi:hypothetical protein